MLAGRCDRTSCSPVIKLQYCVHARVLCKCEAKNVRCKKKPRETRKLINARAAKKPESFSQLIAFKKEIRVIATREVKYKECMRDYRGQLYSNGFVCKHQVIPIRPMIRMIMRLWTFFLYFNNIRTFSGFFFIVCSL